MKVKVELVEKIKEHGIWVDSHTYKFSTENKALRGLFRGWRGVNEIKFWEQLEKEFGEIEANNKQEIKDYIQRTW